jgi:transaldolase
MDIPPEQISDKTATDYGTGISQDTNPRAVRLNTLWEVGDELIACVEALEKEDIDSFSSDDLVDFFAQHGCGDVLVRWSDSQVETSAKEGKIPQLHNWKEALESKAVGLDSLMNLAGLNSFATDQREMDERVKEVRQKSNPE